MLNFYLQNHKSEILGWIWANNLENARFAEWFERRVLLRAETSQTRRGAVHADTSHGELIFSLTPLLCLVFCVTGTPACGDLTKFARTSFEEFPITKKKRLYRVIFCYEITMSNSAVIGEKHEKCWKTKDSGNEKKYFRPERNPDNLSACAKAVKN